MTIYFKNWLQFFLCKITFECKNENAYKITILKYNHIKMHVKQKMCLKYKIFDKMLLILC